VQVGERLERLSPEQRAALQTGVEALLTQW